MGILRKVIYFFSFNLSCAEDIAAAFSLDLTDLWKACWLAHFIMCEPLKIYLSNVTVTSSRAGMYEPERGHLTDENFVLLLPECLIPKRRFE